MGKEYDSELVAIPNTIEVARAFDLSNFEAAISRMRGGDLVVLASGGSLSAAHLLAQLHMSHTSHLATVMTPLEFALDNHPLRATVMLVSASGSNQDILHAHASARHRGCSDLVVVCATLDSKLAHLAKEHGAKGIIEFSLPTVKDGFLATNSLVAFFCLFLRMYDVAVPPVGTRENESGLDVLLEKDELVVLYGGWMRPAAIDLESRFVEAALGPVHIADYRNFAHGRHHWLAKRGSRTGVLALVAPRLRELAEATLRLLPADICVVRWDAESDSAEHALGSLLLSMAFAGRAAKNRGYDAGRPGVPDFGRRIYELATYIAPAPLSEGTAIAIERKILVSGSATSARRKELLTRCDAFRHALSQMTVAGVVLDYDGTVVDTAKRFSAISVPMANALNRLLDEGTLVGIATGRGKSVYEQLKASIAPHHHGRCYVGYYNGGVMRTLSEGVCGLTDGETHPVLVAAAEVLSPATQQGPLRNAQVELRPLQLTVTCKSLSEVDLWLFVKEVLEREGIGAKVVRSSHSVDVLPRSVSKTDVVHRLAGVANATEKEILKIGDRGQWPGNDSELLCMSYGLSVDEVSSASDSCWNLLPFGIQGAVATQRYLSRIRMARYSEVHN